MEEDRFMTRLECAARTREMTNGIGAVNETLEKHGLALYGNDGRGGMVKDIAANHNTLKAVAKDVRIIAENGHKNNGLSRNDKVVVAIITMAGSIIVAIISHVL